MAALLEAGPFSARDGEGRVLFAGATVRLREGELVSLEGPSGSGKTSLLRQVAALDRADGGNHVLAGRGFSGSELSAWRACVTLLAQDAPVLPASVEDNLSFPFSFRQARGKGFDRPRAASLLARLGMGELPMDRDARTLSGGERHRLALVRGLLWEPTVILADEPMSGLDPDSAAACFELLRGWAGRPGHAVMAVFHDPSLAEGAQRRLRLAAGTLAEP